MHAFTQCNVQNSSFSFAKRAKLPLLSLRSFPLTCGIVFGVSDAEEREVYYILLVLRYVYLVRKEKNSDDAGRMCECACFCVCLPPSSLSLSPSRSSNTSKVDETRARIRKSTLRSMIAHKKSWLRRETGVWMLIISYGEFPPNSSTQALIKKWPLKKLRSSHSIQPNAL
jgi:hypothetical protein